MNFTPYAVCRSLFAWRIKFGEIDPRFKLLTFNVCAMTIFARYLLIFLSFCTEIENKIAVDLIDLYKIILYGSSILGLP